MGKDPKRISTMVNYYDYELLQNMFYQNSDGAMVSSFISEMSNIIKLELDGMKIFTKHEISELMDALFEKEISFNTVQPKNSFLYILKDYYKFDLKIKVNSGLLKKIDKLSNLQIIVLARFLLTQTSGRKDGDCFDYDQALHFFLKDEEEEVRIVTRVISNGEDDLEMARKIENILQAKGIDNLDENIKDIIAKSGACCNTIDKNIIIKHKEKE